MGNFSKISGCNYIPTEAKASHNFYLFLDNQGTFDRSILQSELQYLSSLNCKYIRLFQSYWGYAIDKSAHINNLRALAEDCANYGIQILLVMLDGVSAGISYTVNPLSSPWYDLIGAGGTKSWNPGNATNSFLSNASKTGVLDTIATNDVNLYATIFNEYPNLNGGGWYGAPDSLYVGLFDHPEYPNFPSDPDHLSLWLGLTNYVKDTITAVLEFGVLNAVDVFNEPELADSTPVYVHGKNQLGNYLYPALNAEFGSNVIDPAIDQPGSASQVRERRLKIQQWFNKFVKAEFGSVDITTGHASAVGLIEALQYGIDESFFSTHSYGAGYLSENEISGLSDLSKQYNKDIILSEFFRLEPGDMYCRNTMYNLYKYDIGGYVWGPFETAAFGQSFNGTNYAPSPAPNYNLWPSTGLVRSIYDGSHTIIPRRPDILEYVSSWFNKETLEEPPVYSINKMGILIFGIVDQNNTLIEAGSNSNPNASVINWRWAIIKDNETPTKVSYPGIGYILDTANQYSTSGTALFHIQYDDLAMDDDEVLVIQAWFGDQEYNMNEWDQLLMYPVLEGSYSKDELFSETLDSLTGEPTEIEYKPWLNQEFTLSSEESIQEIGEFKSTIGCEDEFAVLGDPFQYHLDHSMVDNVELIGQVPDDGSHSDIAAMYV